MLQGELQHRNSPGIGALELAKALLQQGFSVLLYDYRGRGESGGHRSSAGDREQWGVLGAIDYVNSRAIPTTRIGLLGFSLGAGVAILAAAQVKDIPAIVADSAFVDSLLDLERITLQSVVLPRWFMYPIVFAGRLFFGANYANVRPVKAVPQHEAADCFHQAVEVARRQQAKLLELRAAMSLSRLWQQQGKRQEARELLAAGHAWFTEGFDTADLQEARALLDALA